MALSDSEVSKAELDRRAFRRSQRSRSVLVAFISTLVFAILVWFGLVATPGWSRVQESFFSWDVAVQAWPRVLDGLLLNLRVLAVAAVLVVIFGLLIAVIRTLKSPVFFPLRVLAKGYVDLFRGMPLIIVLYLVGFGIPALQIKGLTNNVLILGTLAVIITYSAYVAEVIRSGILTVHPSQRAAARSLGLSHFQTLRHVVLPQALKRVTPPLLNDLVALIKDTGLVSILGVTDAVRAAQIQTAKTFNYTPYVMAAIIFLLVTIPLTRWTDRMLRNSLEKQNAQGQA